jgi:hypothetical protein
MLNLDQERPKTKEQINPIQFLDASSAHHQQAAQLIPLPWNFLDFDCQDRIHYALVLCQRTNNEVTPAKSILCEPDRHLAQAEYSKVPLEWNIYG